MEFDIKDNLYDLYALYKQHKALYEFYQSHKNIKGLGEVRDRLEYLKKNPKVTQRTEVECLLWFLGELEYEQN